MAYDLTITPVPFAGMTYNHASDFLNKARLSALGMAIYLAGRLACVPAGTTSGILSNRLPVLEVLQKH